VIDVPSDDYPQEERCDCYKVRLRDYFAAKAMQGLLACPMQPQSGPDMYARDAYALADAMLKARGET
jgi:hypothetical protein